MKTTIIGFPRIGLNRELKFFTEKYLRDEITENELKVFSQNHIKNQLKLLADKIDIIPVNDFSFYDNMLDMAFLLGAIEKEYLNNDLSPLQKYFAVAKGSQNDKIDLKAYEMKKWFDTNYHYIVPKLSSSVEFEVNFEFLKEKIDIAKENLKTFRLELIGPFTFLKLSKTKEKSVYLYLEKIVENYKKILEFLKQEKIEYISFEEPAICMDLNSFEKDIFIEIYKTLLSKKENEKVILQTYFGDVRDIYKEILSLDFDVIGLDFVTGEKNIELIEKYGFDENKILSCGVINGRNIWKADYKKILEKIERINKRAKNIWLSTSSSLLHVPYTLLGEKNIPSEIKERMSFAVEKLTELNEIKILLEKETKEKQDILKKNQSVFSVTTHLISGLKEKINSLSEKDFQRSLARKDRVNLQRENLKLPLFPTTTIGSFPQTEDLRRERKLYKEGKITKKEYEDFIKEKIKETIRKQEEIGLDVLVHGEYERNDMVEYFGEFLTGILTTENGWVQSYGTRATKPPVIFGDIKRKEPMTVEWISYAQSLTTKPVKAILTGPATIINWSFVREDISSKEVAFQIALALREEINELQNNNIKIIQVDEAAFREKFPLRKSELKDYIEWVIDAFKLATSIIKPEIELHTHMCYSEFTDTIEYIEQMDADVLSIEAAKSELEILEAVRNYAQNREIGPGVYDIHSPRVPPKEEIKNMIKEMLKYIPQENLWINPDCGLKTRKPEEVWPSLKNMCDAAKEMR